MGDLPVQLDVSPSATRAPRCPYCHAEIQLQGRVLVACEACLTRHHRACWKDGGACVTCGGKLGLSPRHRATSAYRGWARKRARWELLPVAIPALVVLLLAGGLAYWAGQSAGRRVRDDPATKLARALAARELSTQLCSQALVAAGHDDLARDLTAFNVRRSQRFRLRVLNDCAVLLRDLDRTTPSAARLGETLDAHLPGALVDIHLSHPQGN